VVWDNFEELDSTTHAVDLSLQRRMRGNWMLMGNVSFVDNDTYIHGTADLNNPNYMFGRGPTDTNVPFMAKLSGAFILPWEVNLGVSAQHYAGWPETTTVLVTAQTVRLTQVTQELVVESRGTTDLRSVTTLDLTLGKTVRRGEFRVEPRLELFNLLNSGVITRRVTELGPAYGNAVDFLGGRLIKAGFNMFW
jgi:hypothetical protein